MTRRAKLRAVFAAVADSGLGVFDLLDDIETFTADGKSGIETWLGEAYAKFVEKPSAVEAAQDCEDKSDAVADLLEQAVSILRGPQGPR